jgi:hypothetical protein
VAGQLGPVEAAELGWGGGIAVVLNSEHGHGHGGSGSGGREGRKETAMDAVGSRWSFAAGAVGSASLTVT